jgi:hypothetical protein
MVLLGHASLTTSQAYIDATATEQRRSAAANRTYRALDSLPGRTPTQQPAADPGDVP